MSYLQTHSSFIGCWYSSYLQTVDISVIYIFFHVQILTWYRTTGTAQLLRTDLGDSFESTKLIQAQHQQFEHEARVSTFFVVI